MPAEISPDSTDVAHTQTRVLIQTGVGSGSGDIRAADVSTGAAAAALATASGKLSRD